MWSKWSFKIRGYWIWNRKTNSICTTFHTLLESYITWNGWQLWCLWYREREKNHLIRRYWQNLKRKKKKSRKSKCWMNGNIKIWRCVASENSYFRFVKKSSETWLDKTTKMWGTCWWWLFLRRRSISDLEQSRNEKMISIFKWKQYGMYKLIGLLFLSDFLIFHFLCDANKRID